MTLTTKDIAYVRQHVIDNAASAYPRELAYKQAAGLPAIYLNL